MIVTALETVRTADHDNLVWLHLETDAGITGLGETFFAPGTVEQYLHETVAPLLLGQDAGQIGALNTRLVRHSVGYASSGVEMRAASAVDIALWDCLGQRTGLPLHGLLGGLARPSIRIYNTCAGPAYVQRAKGRDVDQWFGVGNVNEAFRHPLDDLYAFEHDPVRLAKSLLDEGTTGMKIWPFDRAAFANGGVGITPQQIAEGLHPFREIRAACGDAMDLMVELHALWDLESAKRIIRAVETVNPLWIEDPVQMNDLQGLAELVRFTRIPILACETLAPASTFHALIAARAVGIVSFDPVWCGGITQSRAICDMAAAAQLPVAPHDCTGPVGYVADSHLALWAPTAMLQETVRAYTRGWYADVVTTLPRTAAGRLFPLTGPGLGTQLRPEFLAAPTTTRRRSALAAS